MCNPGKEIAKLLVAGVRLARVIPGLTTVLATLVLMRFEAAQNLSHPQERDKRQERNEERLTRVSSPIKNSAPSLDLLKKNPRNAHQPLEAARSMYENIQYLSRDHIHHPGIPDDFLGTDSPDQAIQRAVSAQWDNYIQQRPLTVRPSFSASPQTIYLGNRRLANGETAHDMVNLNSLLLINNRHDGHPSLITGHSYTHLIAAPTSASQIWHLEVPYPADARIREAMDSFTPFAASNEISAALVPPGPVLAHATLETPTAAREAPTEAPPASPSVRRPDSPVPRHDGRRSVSPPSYSVVFGVVIPSRESTPSSLPDLIPISSSEEEGSDEEGELCPRCFQSRHSNIDDCSAWRNFSRNDTNNGMPYLETPINLMSNAGKYEAPATTTSTETTPRVAGLQLGFTPIMDNPAASSSESVPPAFDTEAPRSTIALSSLRDILGCDPTKPENFLKIRNVAHLASMQASEAAAMFDKHYAEYEQQQERLKQESSAIDEYGRQKRTQQPEESAAYVLHPSTTQSMTNLLLTRRGSFEMGLGRRQETSKQKERESAGTATVDPRIATDRASRPEASTRIMNQSPMIRDDSDDQPTPALSDLEYITPLTSLSISENASPATERSVESDEECDPREVINAALRRIAVISPEVEFQSPPASPAIDAVPDHSFTEDMATDDAASINTMEFLNTAASNTGIDINFQQRDSIDFSLGEYINHWVEEQMAREDFTRRWDSDFSIEPWNIARDLAYGPLRHLLDFPTMAAENMRDLERNVARYSTLYGPLSTPSARPDTPASDSIPNPAQSPTSLDFSLPATPEVPSISNSMSTTVDSDVPEGNGIRAGKRRTEQRSGVSTADRPKKRFRKWRGDSLFRAVIHQEAIKASHLADPGVLRQLAHICRCMLEGSRRVEEVLVREKSDFRGARQQFYRENDWIFDHRGNLQPYAVCRRLNHALLSDAEAARLQTVHILLRPTYPELAWVLHNLLRLKFRDTYAITQLLASSVLDELANAHAEGWDSVISSDSDPDAEISDRGDMEYVECGSPEVYSGPVGTAAAASNDSIQEISGAPAEAALFAADRAIPDHEPDYASTPGSHDEPIDVDADTPVDASVGAVVPLFRLPPGVLLRIRRRGVGPPEER
jgi:hypothetical protein